MIAAIGSNGASPVVWGLGATNDQAAADAADTEPTWNSEGSAYLEIPERVVSKVLAGVVDCEPLGIAVKVRDGTITEAVLWV